MRGLQVRIHLVLGVAPSVVVETVDLAAQVLARARFSPFFSKLPTSLSVSVCSAVTPIESIEWRPGTGPFASTSTEKYISLIGSP
jgi:hypothetical protein